jgi:hypothetical protein
VVESDKTFSESFFEIAPPISHRWFRSSVQRNANQSRHTEFGVRNDQRLLLALGLDLFYEELFQALGKLSIGDGREVLDSIGR